MVMRLVLVMLFGAMICLSGPGVAAQPVHGGGSGYVPQRVYDSKQKKFIDFESMLAELARADLAFVGEQHDDPATHRLERAILEGLARRQVIVTVAMEMFERDVQTNLDDYLSGKLSEEEFLERSRPWPKYMTDYRPIVEFAKFNGWRVVASNTPRRLASKVSREGLSAVDGASAEDRSFMAVQIQCPFDDYYKRFQETMQSHPGSTGKPETNRDPKEQQEMDARMKAMIERFYYAQCVKDETMAESIAGRMSTDGARKIVVHFNGAFHSDYSLGTAARAIRRMPKSKVRVLTIVPVTDLDVIRPDEYRKKADYVIFCLGKPEAE